MLIYKLSNDNGTYYGKSKCTESILRNLINHYSKHNKANLKYYEIIKDPYKFEIVFESSNIDDITTKLNELIKDDNESINSQAKAELNEGGEIKLDIKEKRIISKEKIKEYNINSYKNNKDKHKEYYSNNKAKIREYQKSRYNDIKEKLKQIK